MNDRETQPETAVSVRGLTKIYRLYQKPAYRLLDLFGLCPPGRGRYTEHAVLQGVDLDINRGEKVAIIGRNGAGKSTLLKIITQTLRATSGAVEINGSVSALLQIGTGFHPDFTGRQNVYSGFAHAGLTGARADGLFDEVVEFSELEEYIDQPMKTYSTGMVVRLMFSASTVLTPDIFVIDELLGVGDAYFAHKSYDRMRGLCTSHGTTLLLVTHDIFSAMKLCDRFIWIDRGTVQMDSDAKTTVTAYERSIKEQEEERLRRRNVAALAHESGPGVLSVRVASRSGFALPDPLALARLTLRFDGGGERALAVADGAPDWTLMPEGNLGAPASVDGRRCRCLESLGSIYHKAEWAVAAPVGENPVELEVDLKYEGEESVEVRVAAADGSVLLRRTVAQANGWRSLALPFESDEEEPVGTMRQGEYGTGLVRIKGVTFFDSAERAITHCVHDAPMTVEIPFEVSAILEDRNMTFVLGFHREGNDQGTYVHNESLAVPPGDAFLLRVRLDRVMLGSGRWFVTIGFAEASLYRQPYNPFFSVNDRWHHVMTRAAELHVESTDPIDQYAVIVHPAALDLEVTAGAGDAPVAPTEMTAAIQESTTQDSTTQDSTTQESTTQESTTQHPATQDPEPTRAPSAR